MTRDDETMVQIFASERAAMLHTSTASVLEYVKKLLCLALDPAKAAFPEYQARAEALRRTYQGIADSPSLQATFRESLKPALLAAPTLVDALQLPFDSLFRVLALEEDG